jgi:hypothetical protein
VKIIDLEAIPELMQVKCRIATCQLTCRTWTKGRSVKPLGLRWWISTMALGDLHFPSSAFRFASADRQTARPLGAKDANQQVSTEPLTKAERRSQLIRQLFRQCWARFHCRSFRRLFTYIWNKTAAVIVRMLVLLISLLCT